MRSFHSLRSAPWAKGDCGGVSSEDIEGGGENRNGGDRMCVEDVYWSRDERYFPPDPLSSTQADDVNARRAPQDYETWERAQESHEYAMSPMEKAPQHLPDYEME